MAKPRSKWGKYGDRGDNDSEMVERVYYKRTGRGRRLLVTEAVSVREYKASFSEPKGWRHGAKIARA